MKFIGFLQKNKLGLKLLLSVVLTVFLVIPLVIPATAATVVPRGEEGISQGRVLADAIGVCINSTLSINPNSVSVADTDIEFKLTIKNVCATSLTTWGLSVAYGEDRVLSNLVDATTQHDTLKSGETQEHEFTWNMAGVSGLTNPTEFYVLVTYYNQTTTRQVYRGNKVSMPMAHLVAGVPAVKDCFNLELFVYPREVTQANTDLRFNVKAKNNCGVPRNTGIVVAYNNDQLLSNLDTQIFDVGESQEYGFNWNMAGVPGLTAITNFYIAAKYLDPTDTTNNRTLTQKSAAVPVAMNFAGVTPGDGGTGTGNVAELGGGANTTNTTGCIGAGGFVCAINLLISGITQAFRGIVNTVIIDHLGPFIETLVSIRTFTDEFASIIYGPWQILRNLGNIFFILAIVTIGVATVFRISGYAVKDVLVKLITGAILINFSLTIAQAILGVADTAQNQFLGPNTGAIRAIINPLVTVDIWAGVTRNLGEFSTAIRDVISFWVTFAAFVALLGVAFLLFARVVIMWILLMLSPLPYVAMVLPATRKFSHQWWSTFFKWAFMTPIIAFMLNLTATITELNNKGGVNQKGIIESLSNVSSGNSAESVALMFAIAGQAIPIAFLYMTIKAGTAFGKGTVGFVDKVLEKGASKAFLPAAFLGGVATGAATKIGSGAMKVAKSPFTLAGKGVSALKDKGMDKLKLEQANLTSWVAPKATDKGVWAGARRLGANVVSGGALWEASVAKRKGNVEDAQKGVKRDARRHAFRDDPEVLKRLEAEDRAEAEQKAGKQIEGEKQAETLARINDLLGKATLDFSEQAKLAASLKKAYDDRTLPDVLKNYNGEIAGLYNAIRNKSGDDGDVVATRMARSINSQAIKDNKLQFAVNADHPYIAEDGVDPNDPNSNAQNRTLLDANGKPIKGSKTFRDDRINGKTVDDLAQIHETMFLDMTGTNVTGIKTEHKSALAKFALGFRDPFSATSLAKGLNNGQREAYKQVLNNNTLRGELEAEMRVQNHNLPKVMVNIVDPSGQPKTIQLDYDEVLKLMLGAL